MGVRVGDTFALASDAVIYACDPGDTAAEFWFGPAREKRCLKARGDVTRYDKLLTPVAAGPQVRVTGAKQINGVDSLVDIAYLEVEDVSEPLVADDFDLPGLTGKADSAPAASDQDAIQGVWLANSESQNGRIWTVDFRYAFSGGHVCLHRRDRQGGEVHVHAGHHRQFQAHPAPAGRAGRCDAGRRRLRAGWRCADELIISRRSRH